MSVTQYLPTHSKMEWVQSPDANTPESGANSSFFPHRERPWLTSKSIYEERMSTEETKDVDMADAPAAAEGEVRSTSSLGDQRSVRMR